MMVKEIRVKAIAQGQEGTFNITVNAEVDRRICLDLMIETVRTVPDVTVYVPIYVVDMDNNIRLVEAEPTVKALVENNIKVEGEMNMNNKIEKESIIEDIISEDQAAAFNALEQILIQSSEIIVKEGGQSYITKIMNSPDNEVYTEMLNSLGDIRSSLSLKAFNSTKRFFSKKKPDATIVAKAIATTEVEEELRATVEEVIDEATNKNKVWAMIKALAVLVFKKAVAALKGILAFTFDTTTILGACLGRVAYHTARELIFSGKAMGQAFNKDVIQSVRRA